MNKFIIKFHGLYLTQYPIQYSSDITRATQYIHPDVAKQVIVDNKLGDEHKVYQVNYVEQEVK
jgi:hypothetical protein